VEAAAHRDAEGDAVLRQRSIDILLMPAGVPKLQHPAMRSGKQIQELP